MALLAFVVALSSPAATWGNSAATPRCAVRLRVTAIVKDASGNGIAGAELWYVDTLGGAIGADNAWRVGSSDPRGNLQADVCYISELFYCANPPKGQATLRFFVLKEGYGALRVNRVVDAERLAFAFRNLTRC